MAEKKKRYFDSAYNLKTTDETVAHYAKWAEVYDEEIGNEKGYRQPQRCAVALKAYLSNQSAKILDVGCGTGLSGKALINEGFSQIEGCDISPAMLEKAEATGIYKQLFETDLNEPPIAAEYQSYDAAVAVGVFSFGHVLPDAIDEILRVIKPKGFLVIGLNDHYYDLDEFPAKLEALERDGLIKILDRNHGPHLENVEGSMGWVITSQKT